MRAGIVFLLMFSIAGVIGIVSLLPSFVYVMVEKETVERSLSEIKNINKVNPGVDDGKEIVKRSNTLTLFNDRSGGETDFSTLIEDVITTRGGVELTSIGTSRTGTTTVVMVVRGIAPTRDSLVAYKGRLESAMKGNTVNLPVSELAKSKDLDFSLTITNEIVP